MTTFIVNQPIVKSFDASKCDRFIPTRATMDLDLCNYIATHTTRHNQLSNILFGFDVNKQSVLHLTANSGVRKPFNPRLRTKTTASITSRQIASKPTRVLDGPGMVNDRNLNLLSWGDNNVLAVGLGNIVYIWNPVTKVPEELMSCTGQDEYITSVAWSHQDTNQLAIGTSAATVKLWDAHACKEVRTLSGHTDRVGAVAWNAKRPILASGSRDKTIIEHDVRARDHCVSTLRRHTKEVTALAWSTDGSKLASAGNDSRVCIWSGKSNGERLESSPKFVLKHNRKTVKALAWCPWNKDILATGCGSTIKFWNASTGDVVKSKRTNAQVCSLVWSKTDKELLSSHCGATNNSLCLWDFETMTKIKQIRAHKADFWNLALAPNGSTVVSASGGEETVKFWEIFAPAAGPKPKSNEQYRALSKLGGAIR